MNTVIHTPQGKLQGEVTGIDNKVVAFKGIPYALPPVGNRRWAPPEPAAGWSGIRLANTFSPQAMQATMPESFGIPRSLTSEDCLYANVWCPSAPAKEKLPVMVHIHGGARRWGSGEINGAALAQKGVVVVSFNYRIGLFGYLSHPELSAESRHGSSGNYAILDQIQALKWVQENIAAFGGDPDNVTLFGCSAGGASIHALVVSPLAKGLFQKVIAQSGSLYFPSRGLYEGVGGALSAEEVGSQFAESAGVSSLEDLRNLPAEKLISIADTANHGEFYKQLAEVIDGWVLPEQPLLLSRQGQQNPVSVMAGFTENDGSVVAQLGYASDIPDSAAQYEKEIRTRYGDLADAFLKQYPSDDIVDSFYNALRDHAFGWASESWVRHVSAMGKPAYLYFFAHQPPNSNQPVVPGAKYERRNGAFHGCEAPYALNDAESALHNAQFPATNKDHTMADILSDYWVAFARTGKPAPDNNDRPEWQPFTESQKHYMRFENAQAFPEKNLLPGMWELMEEDINRRLKLPGVGRDYYAVGVSSPMLGRGD